VSEDKRGRSCCRGAAEVLRRCCGGVVKGVVVEVLLHNDGQVAIEWWTSVGGTKDMLGWFDLNVGVL